jgi:uncharacterized protein (DUF362 family)
MKSKILLRKINSYRSDHIESFVQESVNLLENKRQLFGPTNKILLKPNLLRGFDPDKCVTTHPALIDAVCRILKDLGINKIDLSDSPAMGSLISVAKKAGYGDLSKRYGVRITPLSHPISLNTDENIPSLKIAGSIREYDSIINLPKFKSHCQMTLTLSVKNLFGLVIGKRKPVLHCLVKNDKLTFGKMLIDIAKQVAPSLTIIDGINAMQGNGPINGSPYPLGILAAGQDMIALDRVMTEIVGVPWKSIYTLEAARIKNYGQWDLEQIDYIGELNIDSFKVSDFKLAKFPMDITFNPFRLAKSFLKHFYEVGIKERLAREI